MFDGELFMKTIKDIHSQCNSINIESGSGCYIPSDLIVTPTMAEVHIK